MIIFDILRDILRDKTGTMDSEPDFEKVFNSFMINRYLSMHDEKSVRDIVLESSRLGLERMGNSEYYHYLVSAVPYTGKTFIKYLKRPERASSQQKEQKPKKPLPSPRPSQP